MNMNIGEVRKYVLPRNISSKQPVSFFVKIRKYIIVWFLFFFIIFLVCQNKTKNNPLILMNFTSSKFSQEYIKSKERLIMKQFFIFFYFVTKGWFKGLKTIFFLYRVAHLYVWFPSCFLMYKNKIWQSDGLSRHGIEYSNLLRGTVNF